MYGTLDYQITYLRDQERSIKLLDYVNIDYSGDLDIRRSTLRYVFMIAGGPVSWSSKCQQTIVLLITEAKYIVMTQGFQQALWMHNFLAKIDLG